MRGNTENPLAQLALESVHDPRWTVIRAVAPRAIPIIDVRLMKEMK